MRALLVVSALLAATTGAAAPASADRGCAGTLLRAGDGVAVAGADRVRGTSVHAVVGDGRGGWFVGGDFWQVGSLRVQNLAHLDWNGRALRGFRVAVDGTVTALAVAGRTLYLAGDFRSVDGLPRAGIAAVDASTGRLTPWDPTPGFRPDSLAVAGDTVYLGSVDSIVAVDARSGATRGSTFVGGSPFAVFDDAAYVKGGSGYYGRLAAYATVTGAQAPPTPDARGYFSQLAAGPVRVLAAGRFATGGKRGVELAAWSATSGQLLWAAAAGGSFVNAFAISGRRVYVGGLFHTLSGRKRPRLGAVDVRTGRVVDWLPSFPAGGWTPLTIATNGSRVYVGSAVTAPGRELPDCARRS